MDQPLWQICLNVTMIGFVARRAAIGIGLYWPRLEPLMRCTYIGLLAACAFAAVAIWMSARWVIAAISVLAIAFTVSTIGELVSAHGTFATSLLVQLVLALAGTIVLIALARRTPREPHIVRHVRL